MSAHTYCSPAQKNACGGGIESARKGITCIYTAAVVQAEGEAATVR